MCAWSGFPAITVRSTPVTKGLARKMEIATQELKRAIESQHGCTATLVQSVPVKETFDGKTVWDGIVHVFKINGHPRANKAYAWSSPIEGSDKRRFLPCCISRRS